MTTTTTTTREWAAWWCHQWEIVLGSLLFIWLKIWIKLYNQITPFSRFSRFNFWIYFVRFPQSPPTPSHTHTHTWLTVLDVLLGKLAWNFDSFWSALVRQKFVVGWLFGWLVGCRFLSADAELILETDLLLLYVIIIVVVRPRWVGSVFKVWLYFRASEREKQAADNL